MSEMSKREKTKAFWVAEIQRWETSDLSLIDYCEKHQINQSTLYYWRARLSKMNDTKNNPTPVARLIPVKIKTNTPDTKISHSEYLQVKLSDMIIQIPLTIQPSHIAKLIRAIGKQYD